MEALWAPWRMEMVHAAKPAGCIFCEFPKGEGAEEDRRNLVLGRSRLSFVMLNKFPYNNGHVMVIPRRHTAAFASLSAEELADLHELLQRSVAVVEEVYRPEGMNVGMNLGRCGGAGIVDHMHYHLVPRWNGDTNFMPVLSDTKVMIEHLDESYRKLRERFIK